MTDKELEKIYNEAYRAVYWTSMALMKNESDAEDIVQDTFISLIESYDTIKDKTKVLPWLKKVAANKSLNRLKLTRTFNADDEFLDNVEAVPDDFLPQTIVESSEMRRIVMGIIENSLSDDIRMTLILYYFDEMSIREISEALNVPQGTVSWRLNFAKKKIKKEVEKYEKDNDTKLYMALPFLTELFMKEAEQVPFKPMPATLIKLSASHTAPHSGAATNAVSETIKKGTGLIMKKAIIGISAAVVSAGLVTGGIVYVVNHKDEGKDISKETKIENTVDSVESADSIEETQNVSITETSDDTAITESESAVSDGLVSVGTTITANPNQVITDDSIFLDMDGMTADEVVENIWKSTRVSVGLSEDEYIERLVFPEDKTLYSTLPFNWMMSDFADRSAYFSHLNLFVTNENNVITEISDSAYVDMRVHFTDDDFGKEVFEKLMDKYVSEGYELQSDNLDSPIADRDVVFKGLFARIILSEGPDYTTINITIPLS